MEKGRDDLFKAVLDSTKTEIHEEMDVKEIVTELFELLAL